MEFKNRNPRQKSRPMFDDIPSARWLDDSVWDKTRRRQPTSLKNDGQRASQVETEPGSKKINVSISFPAFNRQMLRLKLDKRKLKEPFLYIRDFLDTDDKSAYVKQNKTKALVVFICLLFVFVVPFTAYKMLSKEKSAVAGSSTVTNPDSLTSTNEPLFEVVKPAGRDFKKEDIVFEPQRKFAKFTDEVNGVPTIVSQQPMPEIYRSSPADGVAKIAKDYGAAELVSVDGQQIYFGQDEKGPMTMIFSKKNLLVFVVTTKAVDKEALKVYVGNFE